MKNIPQLLRGLPLPKPLSESSPKKSTHKSHTKAEYRTCDYLRHYLNHVEAKKMYKRAKLALKKYKGQYDSIAFTGMSGAMIAVPIAQSLRKPLIMVRKTTKDCHSRHMVEGNISCKNYIIIDDLIASGDTVKGVQKKIFEWAPKAHCIGVLEVNYICGENTVLNTYSNLDLDKELLEKFFGEVQP